MSNPSQDFAFDPNRTSQANVDAFLDYMGRLDKELANLLREHVNVVVNATDRERSEARKQFAQRIAEALDASPEE